MVTADARLLVARESYLTGVVGLWILATLLAGRPMVFEATVRHDRRLGLAFLVDAAAAPVVNPGRLRGTTRRGGASPGPRGRGGR